jgi:recombination protein RecA
VNEENFVAKEQSKPRSANTGLQSALDLINKQYGDGSIFNMGDDYRVDIDTFSTGAINLDVALGAGGLPRGRVVEIYGPESSGKTTLALHTIGSAQSKGNVCAFIDVEHALDPVYAAAIGVDMGSLLVSQPDTGEQALEIVDLLVRSGEVAVIVIDSVAALTPRAEIEGDMGDSHVGLQARLMSQALRKLTANISKTNTLVIFINQLRERVGVMYGSPEITSGGKALKFYASVRLDIRRRDKISEGGEAVGNITKVKVVKNKVGPPFREVEFNIIYGHGIDSNASLVDLASDLGIVKKSGAWYSLDGDNIGQGIAAAGAYLVENPEVKAQIDRLVRAAMNGGEIKG